MNVTAPFDMDAIKTYFADKENTFFIVDYDNSKIKENQLITYLSNIGIPCDLTNLNNPQDVNNLLVEYLSTMMLVEIPCLIKTAIAAILVNKGFDVGGIESLLTVEDLTKFNEENAELIQRLETILTSCSVYNMYTINVDEYRNWAESFEHIDDEQYVGVNFVHMFFYEDFYRFYQSTDKSLYRFFDKQFTESMFKGKPLFDYWHNDANMISMLTFAVMNDQFDKQKFESAIAG